MLYFDAFLHLSNQTRCAQSELIVSVFSPLFDWRLSRDELLEYASCYNVLGIIFDLRQALFFQVSHISNIDGCCSEFLEIFEEVSILRKLKSKDCKRLKGRI